MPFDGAPKVNPFPAYTTDWYRHNLELLASYLATGETDKLFTMSHYGSAMPCNFKRSNLACAAGHLPFATKVKPSTLESWNYYAERCTDLRFDNFEGPYGFLFNGDWSMEAGRPEDAADRIAFLLDCPERIPVSDFPEHSQTWMNHFKLSGRIPGKLDPGIPIADVNEPYPPEPRIQVQNKIVYVHSRIIA